MAQNKQAQSQMQVDNQVQQTVRTQTIIQQVDDTIEAVVFAAEAFQKQEMSEKTINRMSDAAVLSLNMFSINCEDLYKEQETKTIKLAQKRAFDGFAELKSENSAVYELIEPHRNFINAALNGQKNLRYKSSRVRCGPTLFQKDAASINKTFAKIIHNNQEFDKQREAMGDAKINQKLAAKHELELKEYDNDDKYRQQQNAARPKQKDLYFTESGKKSQFVDKRAIAESEAAKQAMEEDVHGPEPDVYDKILQRQYMNAVLMSSPSSFNGISYPIPCLILVPTRKQRAKQNKNIIKIRPCYPNNNVTLDVELRMLELDPNVVEKHEESYIKRFDLNRTKGKVLGYKTIKEQDKENDPDLF